MAEWDSGAATGGGDNWGAPAAADDFGGNAGGDTGFGGSGGGGGGGGCFNCGEEGHMKGDCTNPRKSRCQNCNEFGHAKEECTNETVIREFTGTCRLCEQQGHRASDCPSRPADVCNNCKEEGHLAFTCEKPRKIDRSHVKDVSGEEAWQKMMVAIQERDLEDLKVAAEEYAKACPELTYQELEKAFRAQDWKVYLIAIEKELNITYTNMDLQGNLEKKYSVQWRWTDKALRPKEADLWPSSPEENFERLADAGEPVDRGVPKCGNCDELGHMRRSCPQDKNENADKAVVKCYNCDEFGHRVRDCPNPRRDKFACRNCGKSGHGWKECPEPRSAEGVECKKCNEVGHFSRDCPQGGGARPCHNCGQEGHRKSECTNERVIKCRNCDAEGHESRECTQPKDWSRVKCSNCEEMGHTKVRCKQPPKDAEQVDTAYAADGATGDYGAGDTDDMAAPSAPMEQDGW